MKKEFKNLSLGAAIAIPIAYFLGSIGHIAYGDDAPTYINVLSVITGMSLIWVGKLLAGKLLKK